MPKDISSTVNEGTWCQIEIPVTDPQGNPVSGANVDSATMTVKTRNDVVVNGLEDVDVKSLIDVNGKFIRNFVAADNAIVEDQNKSRESEIHIIQLEVTATVGDEFTVTESYWLEIRNLRIKE